MRDALQAKQELLVGLLHPPLTLLEKASLKLIESDILSEEPEKALRMIGRMIESMIELENSPVAKGRGSDQALSDKLSAAEKNLRSLVPELIRMLFARRNADASRRPIDHKKLLDMLVDDVEDKYIDLLEGVRSHTANIDAYIKAVATALDDDFNTQFYYPAFTEVRRASRYHDVTLADIETTNVLANNRGFADGRAHGHDGIRPSQARYPD